MKKITVTAKFVMIVNDLLISLTIVTANAVVTAMKSNTIANAFGVIRVKKINLVAVNKPKRQYHYA